MCGLCRQRSGNGVLTSVTNVPGCARWRSRTAAVSITISPGACQLRRMSFRGATPTGAASASPRRLRRPCACSTGAVDYEKAARLRTPKSARRTGPLVQDHPVDAEPVAQLAESAREERLLQRHEDLAA